MPSFILEKIGHCRTCEAEVEIWHTPKGKTMLADPEDGLTPQPGWSCPREKIKGLLDRFHFREGGCLGGRSADEPRSYRHRYVRGVREVKPGSGHLCRGCRHRVVEPDHGGACDLQRNGGTVYLETWIRSDLQRGGDKALKFARDFTQACTGFTSVRGEK